MRGKRTFCEVIVTVAVGMAVRVWGGAVGLGDVCGPSFLRKLPYKCLTVRGEEEEEKREGMREGT